MIFKAKIKEITEGKTLEESLESFNIDEDEINSLEGYSEISFSTNYGLEKRFLISNNDLFILANVIKNKLDGSENNNI